MPATREQAAQAVQNYEESGQRLLSSFYGHIMSQGEELTQQQTLDRLVELQHHPLKEVGRADGRFALPALYMMSEGNMTLDEVMQSPPEVLQQYGQRYFDMLQRQDDHEITAVWARMGQTISRQPIDRNVFSNPEAAVADFTKQSMLRNMCISHRQCLYGTSDSFRDEYERSYGDDYQRSQVAIDHALYLTEGVKNVVTALSMPDDAVDDYATASASKLVLDSAQDDLSDAHSFRDINRPLNYYSNSFAGALSIIASNMDTLSEASVARPFLNETSDRMAKDTITFNAAPNMHPNEIIKAANRNHLNAQQKLYLNDTYNRTFDRIYPPQWAKALERQGQSPFNLIFINGRPASEAFADKIPEGALPEQRDSIMKEQIALSALSSSARIDYVTPRINQSGDVCLSSPVALKADIQAQEKKPSLWQRFKAFVKIEPIPQSRQQAAQQLIASDVDLAARHGDISSKLPDTDALRGLQVLAHAAVTRREQLLDASDEKFFGHLKNAAGEDLTVKQVVADFSRAENICQVHNVDRPSARNGLVELYAMSQGMTLEQLASDEPQYDEQKAAIGQRYYNMIMKADPQELTGAFKQMARTLSETPLPTPQQLTNPQQMLGIYQQSKILSRMYIGYDQGLNYHEFKLGGLVDSALGADAEKINSALSHLGQINDTIGDFVDQMDSEDFVHSGSKIEPDKMSRIFGDRITLDHAAKDVAGKQHYSDLGHPAMHYQGVAMMAANAAADHKNEWQGAPDTYRADMNFMVKGTSPTARVEMDAVTNFPTVAFGKTQEIQAANAHAERSRVTARELEASERSAQPKAKAPERTTEKAAVQKEHEVLGKRR